MPCRNSKKPLDSSRTARSIRYVLFRIYRKLGRKDDAARELAMHEKLKAAYGTSQQ